MTGTIRSFSENQIEDFDPLVKTLGVDISPPSTISLRLHALISLLCSPSKTLAGPIPSSLAISYLKHVQLESALSSR
ncbi:hypothetical protein RRG08_007772 [Elysia crispata]|uniref:Uncharacterized protein n=1 Tax=Elysia crispata TaxID=231223 RepID=A0AAE1B3L6_9GAST|nr:hypothetical protein RRG08_007772 [Elysia crispata]